MKWKGGGEAGRGSLQNDISLLCCRGSRDRHEETKRSDAKEVVRRERGKKHSSILAIS